MHPLQTLTDHAARGVERLTKQLDAPGRLTLDLSLSGAGVEASNRYESEIARA